MEGRERECVVRRCRAPRDYDWAHPPKGACLADCGSCAADDSKGGGRAGRRAASERRDPAAAPQDEAHARMQPPETSRTQPPATPCPNRKGTRAESTAAASARLLVLVVSPIRLQWLLSWRCRSAAALVPVGALPSCGCACPLFHSAADIGRASAGATLCPLPLLPLPLLLLLRRHHAVAAETESAAAVIQLQHSSRV